MNSDISNQYDAPRWLNYKIGEKAATGDIVKEILTISKKSIIFLDQDENLQWEYNENICIWQRVKSLILTRFSTLQKV